MQNLLRNLWFRDPKEETTFINDNAVKIRAGILLIIPISELSTVNAVVESGWKRANLML